MLEIQKTILALVDVQGKLVTSMHEKDIFIQNLQKLIAGAKALGIPVLWFEQNPERIGPTAPEIQELLKDQKPIAKMCFSCAGKEHLDAFQALTRKQVLLCGLETHVCIYQTAADLLRAGYEVQIAADAVSSRTLPNKLIGLARIKDAGATLTSVEMALFELMRTATHPAFKDILKIVR